MNQTEQNLKAALAAAEERISALVAELAETRKQRNESWAIEEEFALSQFGTNTISKRMMLSLLDNYISQFRTNKEIAISLGLNQGYYSRMQRGLVPVHPAALKALGYERKTIDLYVKVANEPEGAK